MKAKHLILIALVIGMMVGATSCKKKTTESQPDPTPVTEDIFKLSELKYKGKVHILATDGFTDEINEAIAYRFPNTSSFDDCNTIIAPSSKLTESNDQIINAYNKGKTVVVVHPKYDDVKRFFNDNDLPLFFTNQVDSCLLIGLSNKRSFYSMSNPNIYPAIEVELTDEEIADCEEAYKEWLEIGNGDEEGTEAYKIWKDKYPIVYYLDAFVTWLNKQNEPIIIKSDEEDLKRVINSWNWSKTNSQDMTWTVYEYGDAKNDRRKSVQVKATVQTTVIYSIYPVYSFEDQSGNGDYYIVKSNISTPNENVYKGRNREVINGIYCNYDGPCMTEFKYSSKVVEDSTSTTGYIGFFAEGYPVPTTTEVSTQHTTGFNYEIGGEVTGGFGKKDGGSFGATFNFGLQWTDQESVEVPDIRIHANTNAGEGKAAWTYECTDVIEYKSCSNFTEGSAICVSTAAFDQSWGWYYGGTTDGSNASLGQIYFTTNPNYGCAWYIAQGSGRFREMDGPTFTDRVDLVVPCRTPTGQLIITVPSGYFISDINVTDINSGIVYSFAGQTYSSDFSTWIPTGSYTITLKGGYSAGSMVTYKYHSAGSGVEDATITRGNDYNIHAVQDFVPITE